MSVSRGSRVAVNASPDLPSPRRLTPIARAMSWLFLALEERRFHVSAIAMMRHHLAWQDDHGRADLAMVTREVIGRHSAVVERIDRMVESGELARLADSGERSLADVLADASSSSWGCR